MTTKADFNAEEWTQVLKGPASAGMRVMLAERGGTIRESLAMGKAYTEARKGQGESQLLDEILADRPPVDPPKVESKEEAPAALMEQLRTAVKVLESKADSADVEAFGGFVVGLAEQVASAKKEGGVLGIGGKPVSDAEQMAIEEVRAAVESSGGWGVQADADASV